MWTDFGVCLFGFDRVDGIFGCDAPGLEDDAACDDQQHEKNSGEEYPRRQRDLFGELFEPFPCGQVRERTSGQGAGQSQQADFAYQHADDLSCSRTVHLAQGDLLAAPHGLVANVTDQADNRNDQRDDSPDENRIAVQPRIVIEVGYLRFIWNHDDIFSGQRAGQQVAYPPDVFLRHFVQPDQDKALRLIAVHED